MRFISLCMSWSEVCGVVIERGEASPFFLSCTINIQERGGGITMRRKEFFLVMVAVLVSGVMRAVSAAMAAGKVLK